MVRQPRSGEGELPQSLTYFHDHEGRRLSQQFRSGTYTWATQYLYDGQDIHKSYGLGANAWASPVRAVTHGAGLGGHLMLSCEGQPLAGDLQSLFLAQAQARTAD